MPKLLLLISDGLLAKAYGARLTREGFEVAHCTTGFEGLRKARHWTPDLIVLELTLPGLYGLDLLKWLRDVPWLVQVPVVLLIERTLARDRLEACLLWGARSYLYTDACTPQTLVTHLQNVLDQRAHAPQPVV